CDCRPGRPELRLEPAGGVAPVQRRRPAAGRRRSRLRVRAHRRQLLHHRRLRVPGQPHLGHRRRLRLRRPVHGPGVGVLGLRRPAARAGGERSGVVRRGRGGRALRPVPRRRGVPHRPGMTHRACVLVAVVVLAAGCGHKGNKVATHRATTSTSSAGASSSSSSTGSSSSSSSSTGPSASTAATAGRPAVTAAPTTARPPAATAPPTNNVANAKLTKLATLDQPLAAIPIRDGLYVAEKTGKVVFLRNGSVAATVLDISGQVSSGSEQGLLGIAVNGNHLYVDYTDGAGNSQVVEYELSGDSAGSPRQLLTQDHSQYANHNGGNLVFGPDGKLYVGFGDGGGAGDSL